MSELELNSDPLTPVFFFLDPLGLGVRFWGRRFVYSPEELAGKLPIKFENEGFRAGARPLPSMPGHVPLPTASATLFTLT